MPSNSIISEGKTTNEAIENGLKILKVSKNMVNVKILEEDKKSFFSILAPRVVKVELTIKEDIENNNKNVNNVNVLKEKTPVSKDNILKSKNNAEKFLNEILVLFGENITYSIKTDEYGLIIEIIGENASFLIGHRGETLYSFQNIISNVSNKGIDEKIRVILDIGGYKEKREKTLQNLAAKIAKTVEKTGKPVKLEPMQAYERKIIHSYLQNNQKIKTESIGEEPNRRIVISLNK